MLGRHRRKNAANGADIELNEPQTNHNGHKITRGIKPAGESGRKGVHPLHFPRICFRSTSKASMLVNILWPFVPAAIAIHFARPELHVWVFALNYIAMIPSANLVGFAGQEIARKLPKVFGNWPAQVMSTVTNRCSGVLLETFLGGIVEIVLFMVLLKKNDDDTDDFIPVIRAAILGSILANLLLCLGSCFFVGGLRREEQDFDEAISEVGSGLMLVAGFGLLIPSAFFNSLKDVSAGVAATLPVRVLKISRSTAVILFVAYLMYNQPVKSNQHFGFF